MDSEQERKEQALAELRGSMAWEWLVEEVINPLAAEEFRELEDGVVDIRDYEFRRGRISALRELGEITDL